MNVNNINLLIEHSGPVNQSPHSVLGLLAVAGFVQNKTLLGARVRRDKKLLPALSWLSSYQEIEVEGIF